MFVDKWLLVVVLVCCLVRVVGCLLLFVVFCVACCVLYAVFRCLCVVFVVRCWLILQVVIRGVLFVVCCLDVCSSPLITVGCCVACAVCLLFVCWLLFVCCLFVVVCRCLLSVGACWLLLNG